MMIIYEVKIDEGVKIQRKAARSSETIRIKKIKCNVKLKAHQAYHDNKKVRRRPREKKLS